MEHFLTIDQLSGTKIRGLVERAAEHKVAGTNADVAHLLLRRTMAMIFDKPSLRTRLSFEVAMCQLGGHAVYLAPADIRIGQRETVHDTSIVIGSMADIVVARLSSHEHLVELAEHSSVPVINAMTDAEHPCQIIADLLTIYEHFGRLDGLKLAYVGDADNNVTNSLALATEALGLALSVAAPAGYEQSADVRQRSPSVHHCDNPAEAVAGAQVVITDTWVSMGKEEDKAQRLERLAPFQVTEELMAAADESAIFLHCLPAYRGNEVTPAVIDGGASLVFPEAENRLHAQKAIILELMLA